MDKGQAGEGQALAARAVGPVDFARLRAALAGTAEMPRPLADLGLSQGLEALLAKTLGTARRASAVLVPLIMRADGPHLLMTRRSELLRQHKGQISFPGGSRDPEDASFTATALREAHEEIGLPPERVEVIGYLDDQPVMSGFLITPVVGIVDSAFEPLLAEAEVAEIFDLPLARVLAPDAFERKILERDGFEVPFFEIVHGRHHIWGATAGILWQLRRLVLGVAS